MSLAIRFFATFQEQKALFDYLFLNYKVYIYRLGTKKKREELPVSSFYDELQKSYRKVNMSNMYLLSFTKDVRIKTVRIKGDDEDSYYLSASENFDSFSVATCSYENNMILFGCIGTVHDENEKNRALFLDLKKWMKGKYKRKDRFYISKQICDNPDSYRLITVAARLQPPELDLKIT